MDGPEDPLKRKKRIMDLARVPVGKARGSGQLHSSNAVLFVTLTISITGIQLS